MFPARIEFYGDQELRVCAVGTWPAWHQSDFGVDQISITHTIFSILASIAPAIVLLMYWDAIWHWTRRRKRWIISVAAVVLVAFIAVCIFAAVKDSTAHRLTAEEFLDSPDAVNFTPPPLSSIEPDPPAPQPLLWLDPSDPMTIIASPPATANQVRPAQPVAPKK